MKTYKKEELKIILETHAKWVYNQGGKRAVLTGADLRGADLIDAVLRGAVLTGAVLDVAVFAVSRIGSVNRLTNYCPQFDRVWCGCFTGTFDQWKAQIRETYPDETSKFRRQYEAAIAFFDACRDAG